MLKIVNNPEFSHEVTVRVPVDGGFVDQTFTARFRVVDWSGLKDLDVPPEEQLRRVWIGWEGIEDEAGKPLPFSDAARDRLIGMLFVQVAVLRTYVDAIRGATRGN